MYNSLRLRKYIFFQMALPIRALFSPHHRSQLFSPHGSQLKGYMIYCAIRGLGIFLELVQPFRGALDN